MPLSAETKQNLKTVQDALNFISYYRSIKSKGTIVPNQHVAIMAKLFELFCAQVKASGGTADKLRLKSIKIVQKAVRKTGVCPAWWTPAMQAAWEATFGKVACPLKTAAVKMGAIKQDGHHGYCPCCEFKYYAVGNKAKFDADQEVFREIYTRVNVITFADKAKIIIDDALARLDAAEADRLAASVVEVAPDVKQSASLDSILAAAKRGAKKKNDFDAASVNSQAPSVMSDAASVASGIEALQSALASGNPIASTEATQAFLEKASAESKQTYQRKQQGARRQRPQ
jgi:hypothetical protein